MEALATPGSIPGKEDFGTGKPLEMEITTKVFEKLANGDMPVWPEERVVEMLRQDRRFERKEQELLRRQGYRKSFESRPKLVALGGTHGSAPRPDGPEDFV
jgi:hypothetical protein